jgi:NAD(P)-dependent dehydrogenase (short-subunit alcohol dehydrogenase family)
MGPVDKPLADQVALVTGGSRGLGLAVARGLASRGATVVLIGREADRARSAAAELMTEGLEAIGVGCDVADPTAVRALPALIGPLARVDVLVCAAGVMSQRTAKTLRTDDAEWRRVMSVNLDGAFTVISTFVPGMVERRRGRVITLSACLGRFSGPGTAGGLAPYRVSKAGLNALTRNLAAELGHGRRGVLVDATCPGHCRTDMGGPDAPRSPEQGVATALWLATRELAEGTGPERTGLLWEDRQIVPW